MSKIKAIIFDFDGVLVESMDIKGRAFAHLFRNYPDKVEEIVEYHMLHGGLSRFEKFETIYRDMLNLPLSEEKKEELGKEFADFVYKEVIKCPYVNGAVEILEKYYKDLLLFVVSGTPNEEIKDIVRERGLEKYFVNVCGTPEKKRELNTKILQNYRLKPDEVIFVGDSIDDWEGVQGTGIKFIARLVENNPFTNLKVDAVIKDMFDLDEIINDNCL